MQLALSQIFGKRRKLRSRTSRERLPRVRSSCHSRNREQEAKLLRINALHFDRSCSACVFIGHYERLGCGRSVNRSRKRRPFARFVSHAFCFIHDRSSDPVRETSKNAKSRMKTGDFCIQFTPVFAVEAAENRGLKRDSGRLLRAAWSSVDCRGIVLKKRARWNVYSGGSAVLGELLKP